MQVFFLLFLIFFCSCFCTIFFLCFLCCFLIVFIIFRIISYYYRKNCSFTQYSLPAAGRSSDMISLQCSAILPGGLFMSQEHYRVTSYDIKKRVSSILYRKKHVLLSLLLIFYSSDCRGFSSAIISE